MLILYSGNSSQIYQANCNLTVCDVVMMKFVWIMYNSVLHNTAIWKLHIKNGFYLGF